MYLVVSHYTQNKGTTDYLLEYLENNKKSYYYLRHPFNFEKDLNYSELIYFDGKNKKLVGKYKKSNSFLLDLIRNIFLSFYIGIKLSFKINKVIGFGGFNIFPFLYLIVFGKKTYFWGVDYSKKRFGNNFLNKVYLFLETISCMLASRVISSSYRQNEARIKYNHLKKEKGIIINNGINEFNFSKSFHKYTDLSFFYLGSITHQHGILDFIKYFYINKDINNKLYIVGGGELEKDLINTIKNNNLENKVIYLGRKNKDEIIKFLESINEKLFGIAPYTDEENDHVYYGDSLKIREYLNYNIPYLVSNKTYISEDLRDFGFIYDKFENINLSKLEKFNLNLDKKNIILKKYYWDNLFSKHF